MTDPWGTAGRQDPHQPEQAIDARIKTAGLDNVSGALPFPAQLKLRQPPSKPGGGLARAGSQGRVILGQSPGELFHPEVDQPAAVQSGGAEQ